MRRGQKPNSDLLLQTKKTKNVQKVKKDAVAWFFDFLERERESTFSLDFRPFGPLVLDGARSKVTLRGKDYAWAPIWWSFDNSKR